MKQLIFIVICLNLFHPNISSAQTGSQKRKYPDSSSAEKYSVDYLSKLFQKKQWRELLERADLVPLEKRTSKWNKIVSKSIDDILSSFLRRKHNLIDAYMLDFIFRNYEQFLKKKKTSKLVKKVTLKFFYNCSKINYRARYDQFCGNFFDEHYKKLPNDPGYLFEIGKLVGTYMHPKFALKFYSRSLQIKYSKNACTDKDQLTTSDAALNEHRTSLSFKYAQRILFKNCFKVLKTDLIDRTLSRSDNRSKLYLENICRELKAKKVIFPKSSKCRKH